MGSVSIVLAIFLIAMPGSMQDANGITPDQLPPPPLRTSGTTSPGQTTDSAAGQAGARQTQGAITGIDPMARIDNRIQNRVQSRIRNRIDRNYDARSNTASPFEVADQASERAAQSPR